MPHWRVPLGITACMARECLQASAGVNGLPNLEILRVRSSVGIITVSDLVCDSLKAKVYSALEMRCFILSYNCVPG